MSTLDYIAKKYNLDLSQREMPISILNTNRYIMADTLNELGFKVGAEIGVAQGSHSKILCQRIPNLRLFCVDIWDLYEGYNEYTDRINRYYEAAKVTLAPWHTVFVKKFSMDAVKDFEDGSLDFVYIDGAHDFMHVAEDLCEWSKKVRVGGIVYGHDYKLRNDSTKNIIHVKHALQAYVYTHAIKPWFVLGMPGNHADKKFCEGCQSWMFVRQETDRL